MVYAYQSDGTPVWARRIIMGALAYLLSPLDDLGIISFGLVSIACYIDKEVREKAKTKLLSLIKDVDEKELLAVDAKL